MAVTVPAEMKPDSNNYGAVFTPKIYASGNLKFLTGQFNFSDEYPVAGEDMDLSDFFKAVLGVMFETKAGYVFEYDYTNKKVKAMHGNYAEVAAGPLAAVADKTDLEAADVLGVRFIAWGL